MIATELIVTKLLYSVFTHNVESRREVIMAVKHGIMGLLKRAECHGYELQMKFEEIAGKYWPVKKPQFYTTLERLEQNGLVGKVRIRQEKRPDKKVYKLTKDGEDEFRKWLTTPTNSPRTLKDEFFLKASFAMDDDIKIANELFANQRKALLNLLHQLQKVLAEASKNNNQRLALLTKGAILHAEADIKWLEEFEAIIANKNEAAGK